MRFVVRSLTFPALWCVLRDLGCRWLSTERRLGGYAQGPGFESQWGYLKPRDSKRVPRRSSPLGCVQSDASPRLCPALRSELVEDVSDVWGHGGALDVVPASDLRPVAEDGGGDLRVA